VQSIRDAVRQWRAPALPLARSNVTVARVVASLF
jgi:hypothetical protein